MIDEIIAAITGGVVVGGAIAGAVAIAGSGGSGRSDGGSKGPGGGEPAMIPIPVRRPRRRRSDPS